MSSTYRILCLSHTPALELDYEWHSGSAGREAIFTSIKQAIEGHPECDLLMGRYSYPLVEVGCPGIDPHCRTHSGPIWMDRDWLLLLLSAYNRGDTSIPNSILEGCWTLDRLKKLRIHLLPAKIED